MVLCGKFVGKFKDDHQSTSDSSDAEEEKAKKHMQRDLARKLQMEEKQAQKEKNANNGETKRGSFLSRLTGGRRSRRRSSDTNATEDGDNSNVQEKSGKNKKSKSRGSFGAKLFGGGSLGSEKDGSGSSSSSATAGSGATTTTGSSAAGVEGAGGRKFGGTLLWAPFLSPIVVTIKKDGNVVKINYLQIRAERRSKDIVSSMMHSISEIPKIHTIEISKSHIKAWPKNLREMADLRVIKICQNDMRSVIPDLGRVNDLEELHLEDNLIKAIDPSVFAFERFCNLEVLNFAGNQLTFLPHGFGCSLPRLEFLDLSRNRLVSLPDNMFQSGSLSLLKVLLKRFGADSHLD